MILKLQPQKRKNKQNKTNEPKKANDFILFAYQSARLYMPKPHPDL